MKFWDASAIIPLCLTEPWSAFLMQILAEDSLMIVWWGSMVECWSAFARLRREGLFDTRDEAQARAILARLATAWTEVLPSQVVRDHAARTLQLHPLRAADALQLAAALVWVQSQPIGQPFVCLDHRLRAAAQREGFLLIPSPQSLQAPTPPQHF
jgi:predicted nucleic acid-binding protein